MGLLTRLRKQVLVRGSEISEGKPDIATFAPPPQKFPDDFITDCLSTLVIPFSPSLRNWHALLPPPLQEQCASSPYPFCQFQLITGVPPTQAPSWQHLLTENFGKNFSNHPRVLDHSQEKSKADNMASLTPPPTISSMLQKKHRCTKL